MQVKIGSYQNTFTKNTNSYSNHEPISVNQSKTKKKLNSKLIIYF